MFCWQVIFFATVSAYTMPTYDGYSYPASARVIGFVFAMLPIIPIPIFMVWELCRAEGSFLEVRVTDIRFSDHIALS